MKFSRIIGTGSYLPTAIMSNDDLAQRLETSDAWIRERTGIVSRRVAAAEESVVTLGTQAAIRAIDAAELSVRDIELVIVATCSYETIFPAAACAIQQALGIPPGPAFDIQAACTGFIYALSIADQFIRSGMVKTALVVGSETMTRVVDWADRSTCVLFGDGAGAVVLRADNSAGIVATNLQADGEHRDILLLERNGYLTMQGNKVFRFAVTHLEKAARASLDSQQWGIDDIDWLVPHQANIRIIQAMAEKLSLPLDKIVVTLPEQGNTSSASIPLALDAAVRDQRIRPGHRLLLEAIGGGLTWGTALIQY